MSEDGGGEELPEQVDAEEARGLIAGGKVRVIDIRSADDFADERINGSVHCERDKVEDELDNATGGREAVLILCEDGSRSAELAEELRGSDHDVTSIDGGFEAWVGDHLPTAPNPDVEYEGPPVKLPGAVAQSEEPDEDEEEGDDEGDPAGRETEAEADEEGEPAEPRASETEDEETAERSEDA
jgi:rhodanese-related sulfurtransferase